MEQKFKIGQKVYWGSTEGGRPTILVKTIEGVKCTGGELWYSFIHMSGTRKE